MVFKISFKTRVCCRKRKHLELFPLFSECLSPFFVFLPLCSFFILLLVLGWQKSIPAGGFFCASHGAAGDKEKQVNANQ